MKYIVLNHEGEEFMVLFPNHIKFTHKNMAEAVQSIRVEEGFGAFATWKREFRGDKIVSAGFVTSTGYCHGKSESLGIESREQDTELLKSQYK